MAAKVPQYFIVLKNNIVKPTFSTMKTTLDNY